MKEITNKEFNENKRYWFKEISYNRAILNRYNFDYSPWTICRYCNKKIEEKDFDITQTYFYWLRCSCHKRCKVDWEKKEAYECQNIDKACNDCWYFNRDKINKREWKCIIKWDNKQSNQKMCIIENEYCFLNRKNIDMASKCD